MAERSEQCADMPLLTPRHDEVLTGNHNATEAIAEPPAAELSSTLVVDFTSQEAGKLRGSLEEKHRQNFNPTWRPLVLRRRFLLLFACSLILLLAVLETLYRVSEARQGLTTSVMSRYYLWTYGPTAGDSTHILELPDVD